MRRREVIKFIGGVAVWPLVARAQQSQRIRLIGNLTYYVEGDPDVQLRLTAFEESLQKFGWTESHNIHIDNRFPTGKDQYQPLAKQLVAQQPEVIFAESTPVTAALQRETHAIPIVFVAVSDPIGSGFVANLARPGWQHHGPSLLRGEHLGKVARLTKGNRAAPNAGCARGKPQDNAV
jgi:putative tryptophan/tyrosine transport system substrate-binding protein